MLFSVINISLVSLNVYFELKHTQKNEEFSGVATMRTNPLIFKFHSRLPVTTLIVLSLLSFSASVCV